VPYIRHERGSSSCCHFSSQISSRCHCLRDQTVENSSSSHTHSLCARAMFIGSFERRPGPCRSQSCVVVHCGLKKNLPFDVSSFFIATTMAEENTESSTTASTPSEQQKQQQLPTASEPPITKEQQTEMLADEDPLLISQSLTYVTDDGSVLHSFQSAPFSTSEKKITL
jgi:hypothetical protein